MKQLIILAGGKGTRLKDRLHDLPKPLVDVCGKPLLEHQILLAKQHGFSDIILTVHHQAEAIKAFCKDGSQWDVAIRYLEENIPLGTAGAILANLEQFADTFLIMYGDTMLNVDLTRFWNEHHMHHADASLFLHPNDHPHDSDLVDVDQNNRVTKFYPYPHAANHYYPNLVNAALYIVKKSALSRWKTLATPVDFGKNVFPAMVEQKQNLLGYISPEYIKDIGTPERLDKVSHDFQSGKIQRGSLQTPHAAIFLDRDGTLNHEVNFLHSHEQFNLLGNVASSIKRFNRSEYYSIVITNQPVIARGDCTEDDLKQTHNKMETLLGREGAYLDAIYYCPHHPDKGFANEIPQLKIKCDCRKPGIAMISKAQKHFNIDLKQSWFIGDTTTDMKTAKNAGLKSMLVRTGYSGADDKHAARPDFECFDLAEATEFILNHYPKLMQHARKLAATIQPNQKIAVGGLARSGKSMWASLLRYALEERGIATTIITLDGWIKKPEDRGNNVLTRHDVDDIHRFIENIKNSNTLEVPSYNRLSRSANKQKETHLLSSEQVIIFEGVAALLLEKLIDSVDHRFYVDRLEKIRKENFKKEYLLRKFTIEQIEELYQSRQHDENHLIAAQKSNSDIQIITQGQDDEVYV